jgi:hypothetical protein
MSDMQNILAEYADGFLDGSVTIAALRTKYAIEAGSELDHLLHIASQLEQILVEVTPSEIFLNELRAQLIGMDSRQLSLLLRLRHLTVIQLAAGIGGMIGGVTVAAGILWYARRSALDIRQRRLTAPQEAAVS